MPPLPPADSPAPAPTSSCAGAAPSSSSSSKVHTATCAQRKTTSGRCRTRRPRAPHPRQTACDRRCCPPPAAGATRIRAGPRHLRCTWRTPAHSRTPRCSPHRWDGRGACKFVCAWVGLEEGACVCACQIACVPMNALNLVRPRMLVVW